MLDGTLPPAAVNAAAWLEHIRQYAGVPEAEPAPGVFRLHASAAPPPSLPQLLIKAGYRVLVLEADKDLLERWSPTLPPQFAWQGIDGTRIAVCLGSLPSEGGLQALLPSEEDLLLSSLPLIIGELPAAEAQSSVQSAAAEYRRNIASITADFLDAVRPTPSTDSSSNELAERSRLAVTDLVSAMNTASLKRPVVVISNMSHFANEVVAVPLKPGDSPVTAVGPEGESQPIQIVESGGNTSALFIPKNVPLHGYAVWDLGATVIPAEPEGAASATRSSLENELVRFEFDPKSGLISRIIDQQTGRDLLGETGRVHRNGKREVLPGACAAGLLFRSGLDPLAGDAATAEVIERGPVRAGLRFSRTLPDGKSVIKTSFRLPAESMRLDISVEIQWHGARADELCIRFPVSINAPIIARSTALGTALRPAPGSLWSRDLQFEDEPCLWIDASEGDYGVALVSGSPARMGADSGGLIYSLPVPASETDPATVRASFSLLLHEGGLQDGEVVEASIALSRPLIHAQIPPMLTGDLPLMASFFEVDNASVFIHSIEGVRSHSGALKEIFVRLYEAYNTRGEVLLTCRLPVKAAHMCDVLGNEIVPIPLENDEALLPVLPYELITVKYTL